LMVNTSLSTKFGPTETKTVIARLIANVNQFPHR
jgi:hypothetical protein